MRELKSRRQKKRENETLCNCYRVRTSTLCLRVSFCKCIRLRSVIDFFRLIRLGSVIVDAYFVWGVEKRLVCAML